MGAMNAERTARRGGLLPLPRLSGTGRVWILNVGLAAAAVAIVLLVRPFPALAVPIRIPWWALAAMFGLAEAFAVHFQIRREAHAFSLSEIPLVLGLFFVPPAELLLAQLLGAGVALLFRRQSPVKLAFNLGHFMVETGLAVLVFRAVLRGDPTGVAGWLAAFAAVLTTTAVGAVTVTAAISLAEGRPQMQTLPRGIGFGSIVSLTNCCLALIGVTILWRAPEATWLVAVPALILFLSYRSYTRQRQQHETLQALYESTRVLQGSLQVESTIRELLAQARRMFRAELAVLTLLPAAGEELGFRASLGPGDEETSGAVKLDPTEGVWARVASEGQAVLLMRPIQNAKLREHYASRGIHDAMVAPMLGTRGVVGALLVGNHLGDVSTFDSEDLKLFETLANHASVSIENARLVARLEQSLAHLTEMNRLKDDFVATVSHELRTPLTSIQGSIKTMLRLNLGPEDQKAMLEGADRGGDRLRKLIEDLLVVSRIEARSVVAEVADTFLPALARQVVDELSPRANGHRFDVRFEDDYPVVETDEGKVQQILTNLIENALKYSPQGSTVEVGGGPEYGGALVWVRNQGEPIPEGKWDRVFDRFVQVDQSSTRPMGGAGLGLYICRKLAEVVGGRVWIERSDGSGTMFCLSLPASAAEGAADPTTSSLRLVHRQAQA